MMNRFVRMNAYHTLLVVGDISLQINILAMNGFFS